MSPYSFEHKKETGNGMDPQKTVQPHAQQIPIESGHVTFNIGHQKAMAGVTAPSSSSPTPSTVAHTHVHPHSLNRKKTVTKRPSALTSRIWHALEFVAASAVIFFVLFLFMNFDSYSRLFISKLDQIRGTVNNTPYIAQQLEKIRNASPEGQQPLPIVNTNQAAKKQVPDLSLDIIPPDDRILIPRIGQNVPIISVPTDKLIKKDWTALENQIQEALRYGVVHFPGTAEPGESGNVVITGHSSYFPWDPGRFKDVFASLHQVSIGDRVVVYHDQQAYTYEVSEKKVVMPDQVDVLTQKGDNRLTLITCTPVGTNLKRLVVLAKPL